MAWTSFITVPYSARVKAKHVIVWKIFG
jgi:hypothetical protein